ncbi:MAG: thiolase family protein [Deltaproteobacteria bacterium]|nr:MAG: thiolase family protein [Deltaproteobacteria bacterium]
MSNKNVAIAGISTSRVTKNFETSIKDLSFKIVKEALANAQIPKEDVDGFFVTNPGMAGHPYCMLACDLADYLQLETKSLALMETGGTSSFTALHFALDEILSGRTKVNLVLGIDSRAKEVIDDFKSFITDGIMTQTSLYGSYKGPYGIGAPIPYYAMSTQRYLYEQKLTEEDLAEVSVRLRENASRNPRALYQKPISVEEVMASPYLSPPIKLLDCSPFASGAAACVLVSPEVAKDLKEEPIYITGIGEHHHPSHFIPLKDSLTESIAIREAGAEAFASAGIKPADVDVAEVYGVFSGTELMILEDLDFFKKGKAALAFKEGKTALDGEVAVDPSGGRLSLGHPPSATPMMELVEIVEQLRGEAGERQVKNARVGLVHAEHGMLNGSIVLILEKK